MSPRPYRLGQRQAATEQTRARILAAARQLLAAESGLQGFSVDAVARQAGVARMTVYYQFRSRVGLLEALFDDLARRGGMERLAAAFANPDPLAALDAFVATFCRFWDSERTVMRRVRAAAVLDPELEASLRARDDRRRLGLRTLVDRLRQVRGAPATGRAEDAVDLLEALTSFETFDELARTRSLEEVQALVLRTARLVLLGAG